jgi:hypothetical protein
LRKYTAIFALASASSPVYLATKALFNTSFIFVSLIYH